MELMLQRLLVTIAACAAAVFAVPFTASAIVGGAPEPGAPSWMGSLQRVEDGAHACGASLVSPEWAMSAFHCVETWMSDPGSMQLRFGSADRTTGGVVSQAAEVVIPPDANVFGSDIALIRLSTPVGLTPASLPDVRPAPGEDARLIGWGLTCAQSAPPFVYCDEPPTQLHGVGVPIIDDWQCYSPGTGLVPGRELCTGGYLTGKSACFGDSGGPAIVDGRVVGVTSRMPHALFIPGNCQVSPTVYSDVSVHRGWIASVTGV